MRTTTWWKSLPDDRGRGFTIVLATLYSVVVAGCGKPGDYPDLIPVSGTVTMDGQPLAGARVSFVPDGARPSSGTTDASGRYELQYTGEYAGAVVGKHRVSISKTAPDPNYTPGPEEEDDEPGQVETIPKQYRGIDSELTAEVKAGANTLDFDLTSQ